MAVKKLDQLVELVEIYVENWKQFNQFVTMARTKKCSADEENQFLEVKSILIQELELILNRVDVDSPTREEIHAVVGDAPSLRYLSELNEGTLRKLENHWHKIYIDWHANLGRLKAAQRKEDTKSGFGSMFGKKK
jgi:hypothetical protein